MRVKRPFDHRTLGSEVVLAFSAMAVVAAMWLTGWLPAVERSTGDLLLRTPSLRSRPEPPIVAVLIDDNAVAQRGALPWPRDRLARLVATVDDLGARAVIFDLILSEPAEAAGDLALADALAEIPHVLGAALGNGDRWLLPLEVFGGVDAAAHVYGEVGPDGVVRTIAATKQAGGLSLPALSLAAARLLRPQIPVPAGVELRPEFQPPPQDIPRFSASAVLDGELPENTIRDRIVFVGVSATGAGDQFVVPTGPRHAPVPGVLTHASAATSILSDRLIRRPGGGWIAVAAFVLALAVQALRSRRGTFDLGRFSILFAGLGVIAVVALHLGLVLVPLATLMTVVVVSALLREAVESRAAHRESGRLLQSLLEHIGARSTDRVPQTASRRLEALQRLQEGVLREDATRRALLAGMAEGVALWGAGGELLEVNPAAEKLWGGLPLLGEIEAVLDPATGEGALRRAGRELSLQTSPIEDGLLAIIRDVTAEHELERRRREMQRLVSHELKTPLASISGFGETLERYELTGDEQRRVASLIRGEAARLQEMVTVFLDLERLGAGHWEGEAEIVDFGELVRGRLEILAAAADAREQSLAPSVADRCRVRGVPALLERVVDNLVGNAIKYSVDGDAIEVVVRADGGRIVFEVSDHGPGIPADEIPRLTERFYRIAGAAESGSGLGLALVDEIATWHGGCIDIESETGAGSTFTVELPAVGED